MYFLMAMNSHTCLSGASHADMHLTGYISHRACVLWACISEVYNSEVCLIEVPLLGVYSMGVHSMARLSWGCLS